MTTSVVAVLAASLGFVLVYQMPQSYREGYSAGTRVAIVPDHVRFQIERDNENAVLFAMKKLGEALGERSTKTGIKEFQILQDAFTRLSGGSSAEDQELELCNPGAARSVVQIMITVEPFYEAVCKQYRTLIKSRLDLDRTMTFESLQLYDSALNGLLLRLLELNNAIMRSP